ncbi:hypothetical protein LTR36_005121 [Oleoguttula mirabilis]|uniref:YCII-related domain-containing protein n=1 Tax=Oleoguttula mirabilis TaxID=1507867 RepID=A0AAV9JYW2_9PEZI|nr:hypothetical protein LTR36_005121 [Oleoguttula mirabilis]
MASKQEWMIILPDKPGMLGKRMEVRPDHLSSLKPLVDSNFFVFGGASLDEPLKEGEGPKINGSVMLALADTKEEVLEKIRADVYSKSGVWDESKELVMCAIFPSKATAKLSTSIKKRKRSTLKPWYEGPNKRRATPRATVARSAATATIAVARVVRPEPTMLPHDPGAAVFGGLSGELRNIIYKLALWGPDGDAIRITSGMDLMGRNLALGLLGTCKAVRKETLGLFYDPSNSFRVDVVKLNQNTRRVGPFDYFTDCYDSRRKAYEDPIRKFIASLRYTSRLDKPYGLKAIPSFTFAYFNVDPAETASLVAMVAGMSPPLLPDTADLVLIWKLQPEAPYYSLTVDYSRTDETNQQDIDEVMSRMRDTIGNMVEMRTVRLFAAADVLEIADRFYYSCMNLKIGV